jgi:hypothetical protein
MKIAESSIQLSASHDFQRSQRLEVSVERSFKTVFTEMANAGKDEAAAARERVARTLQSLVDAIIAALDGKKCPENLAAGCPPGAPGTALGLPDAGPQRELHWQCSLRESIHERETTQVCGSGKVLTCDGREIAFDFSLSMQREFRQERSYHEKGSVILKDPLVLNFAGLAAELTGQRLQFDLDADGITEDLPGLGAGSGFLVFDRNGNGRADNGRELFGALSGNGFADLAALDKDGNGWIDAGDPDFARLSVWSATGLSALGDLGVGALYTAAVDSPFMLKTADNSLLGQIRSTGIYLTEAGRVGPLQQIDLAVSDPAIGAKQPAKSQELTT